MQRSHVRLVFDYAELGDMQGLDASIRAYELGARQFQQGQYQWPAIMLQAMRALMAGRFAESDRLSAEAQSLGERHRDPNATICVVNHRIARFHASESYAELMAAESNFRQNSATPSSRPSSIRASCPKRRTSIRAPRTA